MNGCHSNRYHKTTYITENRGARLKDYQNNYFIKGDASEKLTKITMYRI